MEGKNMVDYEGMIHFETIDIENPGEDKIQALFENALGKIDLRGCGDLGIAHFEPIKKQLEDALKNLSGADVYLQQAGGGARARVEDSKLVLDLYLFSENCTEDTVVKQVGRALAEAEIYSERFHKEGKRI